MFLNISEEWKPLLKDEFDKPYFSVLNKYVDDAYNSTTCYPPKNKIFAAFDYCTPKNLKVVIIGQDPYHGLGQANGLCFSVDETIPLPPSLKNIFKEIEQDLKIEPPKNGNLERWAKQGVLLLNATLTVAENKAGSHQKKGWEIITNEVIRIISEQQEGIIFMLWGGFAKKKSKLIDTSKHHILTSGHPSPLSANRGYWFGNKHFSQVNKILNKNKKSTINW